MRLLLVTIAALGLLFAGCAKDGEGEKGGEPKAEEKAGGEKAGGEKAGEPKAEEPKAADKAEEPKAEEPAAADEAEAKVMTVVEFDKDYRSLKGLELMEKYSDPVAIKGKVKKVGTEMDESMFLWLDVDGTKWVSLKFTDKGAAAKEKGVAEGAEIQATCDVAGATDKYIMMIDCKLQ